MASLLIQYADGRKASVPITRPELIIGRDSTCDVVIDDTITSRRHARLSWDGSSQFWMTDLGSKNGTTLNDAPIGVDRTRLRDGDRIGVGTCCMVLRMDSKPPVLLMDTPNEPVTASTSAWRADQRLELPQKRLEKLLELTTRLAGRFDRDDFLNEVLEISVELLRLERVGVAIVHGEQRPVEWVRLKYLRGEADREFRISRSLVDKALHEGQRILINDTASGPIDPTASMISNHICSAMCVPMEYHKQVHGVLYGDRVSTSGGYTREDIDFFAALGGLAAMGLANIQLIEEMKQRQRVEAELNMAREIQSQLFPREPLHLPPLTIEALNDPGLKVSGDYYDYFQRPDGRVVAVIADVAGKGAPAALLMANLQGAVHIILNRETDLVKSITEINALISRNVMNNSRFITTFIGLLDLATRKLAYVNAGHLFPYLITPGGEISQVVSEPCHPPLGITDGYEYQAGEVSLGPEPRTMLLYTDGIPDAENESGERFGQARLEEWLQGNGAPASGGMLDRLRRSIKQFTRNHPQTDDITLLAMHFA
jgi:serine phosphatase RsbU (regulator of sigma subunit)